MAHDKIWKPDLTVINGAENLPGVAGSHIALGLSSYGQVEWLPGNVFSVTCKMTLTNFPFDEQDCFLVVKNLLFVCVREREGEKGRRRGMGWGKVDSDRDN